MQTTSPPFYSLLATSTSAVDRNLRIHLNLVSATAEELLPTGTGAATDLRSCGLRTARSNSPDEKYTQGGNCRGTAPRVGGAAYGSLFNISNWSSSG